MRYALALITLSAALAAASPGVPTTAKAEDVGMSTERLARIHDAVAKHIEAKDASGHPRLSWRMGDGFFEVCWAEAGMSCPPAPRAGGADSSQAGKASRHVDPLALPLLARIVQRNVYGWFARPERGIYTLSNEGSRAVRRFAEAISALPPPTLAAGSAAIASA